MGLTAKQLLETSARRVQRHSVESEFVNTINIADRVTIDFVWYPGARDLDHSLVDAIVPFQTWDENNIREISYDWARDGRPRVKRKMVNGRVTLDLPPGASGMLTAFETTWKIVRKATYSSIEAANSMVGVQRRLNALGYHLRSPGDRLDGLSNQYGQKAERAVLSFQVDYRQPVPAPAGSPAGPLRVRGEWAYNDDLTVRMAVYNDVTGPQTLFIAETLNQSLMGGAELQAALVAIVGS
jgi:hypothetical protein